MTLIDEAVAERRAICMADGITGAPLEAAVAHTRRLVATADDRIALDMARRIGTGDVG